MTLAASIDSNLIYLIAAAAYGVFAWWNDRRQKKAIEEEEKRRASEPKPPGTTVSASPAPSSEEERTRRFLEALGVPTNQLPPAPRPAPAPKPQPQPKPASPTLAPRPIAMPVPGPIMRPAPAKARPAQVPVPVPVPAPVQRSAPDQGEMRSAEFSDSTNRSEGYRAVDQISTDFTQMHSHDLVLPMEPSAPMITTGAAPTTTVQGSPVSSETRMIRGWLATPESLRAAVILREVLGPPPGL